MDHTLSLGMGSLSCFRVGARSGAARVRDTGDGSFHTCLVAPMGAQRIAFHISLLNSRTKSLLVTIVIQWYYNCMTKIARKTIIRSLI